MRQIVRSEAFKLRTTRTFFGITLSALALVLVISIAGAAAGKYHAGDHPLRDLLGVGGLAQLFALVLGILAVSTEFRHGTITPSLLAIPSRPRLVLAKVIANGVGGLLLGLVAFVLSAAVISVILSARGVASGAGGSEVVKIVVGGTLAAALYAILGVGLGALLRNQVGAIVGALGWIFVIENLIGVIPGLDTTVQKFGLNGLASGLTGTDHGSHRLGQVPAGLLLAAYAAIFVLAGIAVLRRRDVSA